MPRDTQEQHQPLEQSMDSATPQPMDDQKEYGNVTAHVKDSHRNCVALSRAKDGLILVGQLISWHTGKEKDDKTPLGRLAAMLIKKGLIVTERQHVDTHPLAIAEQERNKHVLVDYEKS